MPWCCRSGSFHAPFAGHVTVSIARGIPEILRFLRPAPSLWAIPGSPPHGGTAWWNGSPIDGSFNFDTPAYEPDSVRTYTTAITLRRITIGCTSPYPAPWTSASSGPAIVFETDFEADNGGFMSSGTGSMWEHGAPVTWPVSVPSGVKCWGRIWTANILMLSKDSVDPDQPGDDLAALRRTPVNVPWMQTWALRAGTTIAISDTSWMGAADRLADLHRSTAWTAGL